MVDLFIDPLTKDLSLVSGIVSLTTTEEDATRQRVDIHLNTFKGEVFWSIESGIPYLANDNNSQQLLGKTAKRVFDGAIKEGIVSREGITALLSYNSVLDRNKRTITVSFEATTEEGDIITGTNLEINV